MPGETASAEALTDFPDELFADHFPSLPITPGVLLTEMGAQLSGLLVQATLVAGRDLWVFPFLGQIEGAKFRSFVGPRSRIGIRARIASLRDEAALCKATVTNGGQKAADMTLILVFDPNGDAGSGDPAVMERFCRDEYRRLTSPWQPPDRA